jgi:quercetin dioxygenase-like cupin family protein
VRLFFIKENVMKNALYLSIVALSLSILFVKCRTENTDTSGREQLIFPKGALGPKENFTGNAYNFGLVQSDSTYTTLVGNVYFETGSRSNWHKHPGGQVLIITDGEGYHQIEGQPRQIMKKGDVVKCPPNTKHWHGASANSSLSQMYIVPNTEKGIVTWLEPVTDEQYNAAN